MAKRIISPGRWVPIPTGPSKGRIGYSRRIKTGSRSGSTEVHDRRLNREYKHAYGRDKGIKQGFGEFTSVEQYRKHKGRLIRKHRRRKSR